MELTIKHLEEKLSSLISTKESLEKTLVYHNQETQECKNLISENTANIQALEHVISMLEFSR